MVSIMDYVLFFSHLYYQGLLSSLLYDALTLLLCQYVGPHTTPKLAATRKPRRTRCKLSFDLHGSVYRRHSLIIAE